MYNDKLHFHFIGIGGSGMSGIAEVLVTQGFKVSGTDIKLGDTCKRLSELGVLIKEGHDSKNLPETASLVVYSSAVKQDNPEIQEAKKRKIPIIQRAEVLAELMRLKKYGISVAGSHGKTTTTSFIGEILEFGGLDPTVIIGGKVKTFGTGGKVGQGDYLVAESDESDRSFLMLKPTITIVTNIDKEHLSAYKSFDELIESFATFAYSVPFYGLAIFCTDCPYVKQLSENYGKRKLTYGFNDDGVDITAKNIIQNKNTTSFDVIYKGEFLFNTSINLPGRHFILNSLAAIGVGMELDIKPDVIALALSKFGGVSRRIEILSEKNDVTVINDYGHHPTEIKATLKAIKEGWKNSKVADESASDSKNEKSCRGNIKVIFQPHRYTRTRDSFEDFLTSFDDADEVFVVPIYNASEEPIEGVSSEILAKKMQHPNCRYLSSLSEIYSVVKDNLRKGDIVVFQGAGSIGNEAVCFANKI